jgi:hypothetical protein
MPARRYDLSRQQFKNGPRQHMKILIDLIKIVCSLCTIVFYISFN